jgi:hypothetical protein
VTVDLTNIERHYDKRSRLFGWNVYLSVRGRAYTRYFADKKHGGRDAALALALRERDRMRRELGWRPRYRPSHYRRVSLRRATTAA